MLNLLDRLSARYYRWRGGRVARAAAAEAGIALEGASVEQTEDGQRIQARFSSSALAVLVDEAAALLDTAGAANYLEITMVARSSLKAYRVTIQNLRGESPAEQNARLRDEVAALRKQLEGRPDA